jgi:hypothetical protein
MPRGDYNYNFRGKVGHNYLPSHNCVWVKKEIKEEEFADNWERIFGCTTHRPELSRKTQCTCNFRESEGEDEMCIITWDACDYHKTKAGSKTVKVTDAPKHFSWSHMRKLRDYIYGPVIYGDGKTRDMRDVLNRN